MVGPRLGRGGSDLTAESGLFLLCCPARLSPLGSHSSHVSPPASPPPVSPGMTTYSLYLGVALHFRAGWSMSLSNSYPGSLYILGESGVSRMPSISH